MDITIIVAVAENGVIGKDNQLIWHLPDDMRFFKEKTTGHCVLTGRKNYDSIPGKFRPLSNRINLVVTRQKDYQAPGAIVFNSIADAVSYAREKNESELFIIGGAEIYSQMLDICTRIYLTRVHHSFDGDTYFNAQIDKLGFELKDSVYHAADEKHKFDFTFETWERIIKN